MLRKQTPKTPLGRWHIETCNKKINSKIDFANEDHCGPCGKNHIVPDVVYMHKMLKKKN